MNPEDPLSQLADIHLPESITAWPPAYGWWILSALVLFSVFFLCRWYLSHRRKNRFKTEATATLSKILEDYHSNNNTLIALESINALLKQTCMTHFGRHETAGLSGEAWLTFLDNSGKTTDFSKGPGRSLTYTLYTPNPVAPIDELVEVAQKWIAKQS